jgi:hypothetical protein
MYNELRSDIEILSPELWNQVPNKHHQTEVPHQYYYVHLSKKKMPAYLAASQSFN